MHLTPDGRSWRWRGNKQRTPHRDYNFYVRYRHPRRPPEHVTTFARLHVTTFARSKVSTLQRLKAPTCQRSNVSTFQRVNVSTFQRVNVSTFQRVNVPTIPSSSRASPSRPAAASRSRRECSGKVWWRGTRPTAPGVIYLTCVDLDQKVCDEQMRSY